MRHCTVWPKFIAFSVPHIIQCSSYCISCSSTIWLSLFGLLAMINVFGMLTAHWPWMRALSWHLFHCWSARVLWIYTAQGGGRYLKINIIKIAVISANGRCTATTMALTSIMVFTEIWLWLQLDIGKPKTGPKWSSTFQCRQSANWRANWHLKEVVWSCALAIHGYITNTYLENLARNLICP